MVCLLVPPPYGCAAVYAVADALVGRDADEQVDVVAVAGIGFVDGEP